MVYKWLNNTLSYWAPPACVLCGASSTTQSLCHACQRDLPQLCGTCQRCGLPLNTPDPGNLCGHCLQQPPAYDRVISRFAYAPPISQLVGQLKFHGRIQLARLLGELLAESFTPGQPDIQALLPVPLHPRRLRQRGFNQALEIARPMARSLRLPILQNLVYRHRDTPPQSEQKAHQRQHNLRNAFALRQKSDYRRIAIIDDVMTSGHTVNEIAKLLKIDGVETVEVWCVARAWPHYH